MTIFHDLGSHSFWDIWHSKLEVRPSNEGGGVPGLLALIFFAWLLLPCGAKIWDLVAKRWAQHGSKWFQLLTLHVFSDLACADVAEVATTATTDDNHVYCCRGLKMDSGALFLLCTTDLLSRGHAFRCMKSAFSCICGALHRLIVNCALCHVST